MTRSSRFRSGVPAAIVAALLAGSSAATAQLRRDLFTLGFAGPEVVSGPQGASQVVVFDSTLAHEGAGSGAQAWSAGITVASSDAAAAPVEIVSISLDGTDAEPLIQTDGFRQLEVVRGGAVAAVVLSAREDVTLPPRTRSTIARVGVRVGMPVSGRAAAALRYVDGLAGSGEPVRVEVTSAETRFVPAVTELEFGIAPVVRFIRGDVTDDGLVTVTDAVRGFRFMFTGRPATIGCLDALDMNDDGVLDIVDGINILEYLFNGRFQPAGPVVCSVDATRDRLDCASYTSCLPEDVLTFEREPFGPTQEDLDRVRARLLAHAAVRDFFADSRFRLLHVDALDDNLEVAKRTGGKIVAPSRFRGIFYDYTRRSAFSVEGDLVTLELGDIVELDHEPRTNSEELAEATEIARADPLFARFVRDERYFAADSPMPRVTRTDDGDRLITFAFWPNDAGVEAGVPPTGFGVDMVRREVLQIEAIRDILVYPLVNPCETPTCDDCPSNGTAGMVKITIKKAGKVLWTLHAVRPAASSGHPSKRSAIEVRYVRYRGKLVLWRGHVPILNVRYAGDACGPYRDWQDQEVCFNAPLGSDVTGTGFRVTSGPATTLAETPSNDCGNFRGVAIFVEGQKVVLLSELKAGWYRYIPRWEFYADGRIRPRFAFAATKNSCTCKTHYHHAYFRLDMDIETHSGNRVVEFTGGQLGTILGIEERRIRGAQPTSWRISNVETRNFYTLEPGAGDELAIHTDLAFTKGDFWVLRYHGGEIEDGVGCVSCSPAEASIQIDDTFVNGEATDGQDVVVWYAANFTHAIGEGGEVTHVSGPWLGPSAGVQE